MYVLVLNLLASIFIHLFSFLWLHHKPLMVLCCKPTGPKRARRATAIGSVSKERVGVDVYSINVFPPHVCICVSVSLGELAIQANQRTNQPTNEPASIRGVTGPP